MLPQLLPCFSLDYLGWQLVDQPFLFYIVSSFHPSLARFPRGVYNACAVSCGFFASLPPSPILSSFPLPFPLSSSPFPSPLLLLSFPSPLPTPFPSCVRLRVSTPVPVCVCVFWGGGVSPNSARTPESFSAVCHNSRYYNNTHRIDGTVKSPYGRTCCKAKMYYSPLIIIL